MKVAAIVLAAGKQTRFGEGIPKSLYTVGGQTILGRMCELLKKSKVEKIVLVTNADYPADIFATEENTQVAINSETILESIQAGLEQLDGFDYVFVCSADTYILRDKNMDLGFLTDMYYDPFENVTLFMLNAVRQYELRHMDASKFNSKMAIAAHLGMTCKIVKNDFWMNINTQGDLERARKLYDSSK